MKEFLKIDVQCYSGGRANERPLSFILGSRRYTVSEILDRWYGPDYLYIKIRDIDGSLFIIRCNERDDIWEIQYFNTIRK